MRNLKRILSLAMASIMLVGMMVVGASAVDFPDSDKIENTDAVNTLVSLGIIKGKDDGNFDPEGIVTRAEMAKMICVALNGGKDPNLTGGGLFPDTKGHWASGYIDYCKNLGIVAGDTNGNFNPGKTVTGVEAAKMILIAIGYRAEEEGFVNNANWDVKIGTRAGEKGLYDDIAINPSEGLSRDNAAQMIYNGLNAVMVEYDYKLNTVNGDLVSVAIAQNKTSNPTILSDKFELLTRYGYMTSVSYDEGKKVYTYNFEHGVLSDTWAALADIDAADQTAATLKSANDYSDMFGKKVKTLYKNNSDKTVYGMYTVDSEVLYSGVCADVTTPAATATEVKVDGTTYKLDAAANTIPVLDYNQTSVSNKLSTALANGEYEFSLVDVDGNGKADQAIVLPFTVKKVTFSGKDGITAGAGYTYEDDIIAEGIVKGDYVKIVAAANTANSTKTVITKAEIVSGDVDGVKSNGDVQVDGTWYKKASSFSDSISVGETYDLAVNGKFIYAATQTSESATLDDVLYVSAGEGAGTISSAKTEVYFMDGTKQVVSVTKVDGTKLASSATVTAQTLYTFKLKNGNYELTTVSGSNKAGFDGYNGSAGTLDSASKDRLNGGTGLYVADDAIVVVDNNYSGGTRDIKFYTGKAAKAWSTNYAQDLSLALYDTVNGLDTAKVLVMGKGTSGSLPSGGDQAYGYITSDPMRVKDGDDYYDKYTLWTDKGEVTVLDSDDTHDLSKGQVIKYDDLGDGKIENSTTVGTPVAIVGYGAKSIKMANAAGAIVSDSTLNDDTKYLYVNTKDAKGVTDGEIDLATQQADGSYIMNAWYVGDTDKVQLVVYDVNNDLDGLANTAGTGAAGYAITIPDYSAGTGIANINTVDAVKWTVDGLEVANNTTAYAVAGAEVVATVKGPSAGLSFVGSTTTITGSTGAVASVKTAPTFTGSVGSAAVSASSTAVTFTKDTATGFTGGEFTFTWTVSAALSPAITGVNS